MRTPRIKITALVGLAFLATTSPANAGGVSVQTFSQATGGVFETTESPFLDRGAFGEATGRRDINVGAHYHFADNPLVEYNRTVTDRKAVLVDGIHTMQLSAGIQQKSWGMNLIIQAHQVKLTGEQYRGAFGDTRLQGKVEVARSDDNRRAFALVPELYFPTGNAAMFVSNGGTGIGLKGSIEQELGRFRAAASLGYISFDAGTFREIDYRSQMPYSLAVAYALNPRVRLNAEFFQSITFPRNGLQNPGELYLGSKIKLQEGMIANAGISLGQLDFLRSNDIRIHLGVQLKLNTERAPATDRFPARY